jgi:hypothetical protein
MIGEIIKKGLIAIVSMHKHCCILFPFLHK